MYNDEDYDEKQVKEINDIYDKLEKYVIDNFLIDYLAYYIFLNYKCSFNVLSGNLKNHLNSAMDSFNMMSYKDIDIDKLKAHLRLKYKLKIISDNPIKIIEVK